MKPKSILPILSLVVLCAALLSGGCTPEMYRRWADQDVDRIVHKREDATLGYTPEVVAPVSVSQVPQKQAYDKVPTTPKPPATTSPVEASDVKLAFGPLGPEMLFPSNTTAPQENNYGLDAATLHETERLALGPPAPGDKPTQLDLFGSIGYAVHHSRDYMSQMEGLYLQALDVTLQRHLFEPRPFASTGLHYAGGQENADYAAALTAVNAIGVKQQLPYGGEITAEGTVNFVRAISGNAEDGETANMALSASIPLLKGAGMVNLEPLIESERTMVYQIRQFEDYRRNFVVDISSRYFNLLTSQQSIADRSANLVSLQSLTARSQALYAAGRQNYIDVQRSLRSQLQAEQDLINAQASYRRAIDDFKLALGMPVDAKLEIVAQELSVIVPRYTAEEVAQMAIKYRLDLRTAEDRVEDAQRNVANAKNGLLPDLSVFARGTTGNNTGRPAVAIANDTSVYSAGVDLDIPLDQVAERNTYRASLIGLERSSRSVQQLRDQIVADTRDALRLIRSAEISLDIQTKGIELAKLTLDNANERLRQGKSDNRDVVDAQNALLTAQDGFEQAKAVLQIQVLKFLRDTGSMRVDPNSGSIGQAMDRRVSVNEPLVPR